MSSHDSGPETRKHIERVRAFMSVITLNLGDRAYDHDKSKLESPEKEAFDSLDRDYLATVVYGSEEYKAELRKIKPAIEHHYMMNSHHPEFWENGVADMSAMDILEMLADWKAAGERTKDSTMEKSIMHNVKRHNISPEIEKLLRNTCAELGWL